MVAVSSTSTHPPAEESFFLSGPAGRLEARWRPAPDGSARGLAALLCHPHPLYGGSLSNKVLYRIARGLSAEWGVPSLRFNTRGVGASAGTYDGGAGEIADTAVALTELGRRARGAAHVAIGFSFGAAIGLRAATAVGQVVALVALGLPVSGDWDLDFLIRSPKPLLVVQGERDEFGRPDAVRRRLADRSGPTLIHTVAGTSHLFPDHEERAVSAVLSYIGALDVPHPE